MGNDSAPVTCPAAASCATRMNVMGIEIACMLGNAREAVNAIDLPCSNGCANSADNGMNGGSGCFASNGLAIGGNPSCSMMS